MAQAITTGYAAKHKDALWAISGFSSRQEMQTWMDGENF